MLPNQQIKTTAALALALGALTPAAAAARPQLDPPCATHKQTQTSPIVRVITPNSGFDWGDAGIGAAGGLGSRCSAWGERSRSHSGAPATPTARQHGPVEPTTTTQEHTHHVHA